MKARYIIAAILSLMLILCFATTVMANEPQQAKSLADLNIGDIVFDSSWEWEHKTGDNYSGTGEVKNIEWIVVDKNHNGYPEGSVTLLSTESIAKHHFSREWDQRWDNPYDSLRDFLNGDFYNQFSESFKAKVMATTLPNITWNGISYTTIDNVFVLSCAELGGGPTWVRNSGTTIDYFKTDASIKRKITGFAPSYWTRSPDANPSGPAVCVQATWTADNWANPWAPDSWFGARPAINLSADTLVCSTADGKYEITSVDGVANTTIEYINSLSIDGKSYSSQLTVVSKLLKEGNTAEAKDKLNAFINHVKAQKGKKISEAQAVNLINAAKLIITNID